MPRPAKQHYLPASVIGGFGLARSAAPREALVAVRRKGSAEVTEATAESVAYERGLYTLQNPPPGVTADQLDNLWTQELEPPFIVRLVGSQTEVPQHRRKRRSWRKSPPSGSATPSTFAPSYIST